MQPPQRLPPTWLIWFLARLQLPTPFAPFRLTSLRFHRWPSVLLPEHSPMRSTVRSAILSGFAVKWQASPAELRCRLLKSPNWQPLRLSVLMVVVARLLIAALLTFLSYPCQERQQCGDKQSRD